MSFIKRILKSKKVFYSLLIIIIIFLFLEMTSPPFGILSCSSSYPYLNWQEKSSFYLHNLFGGIVYLFYPIGAIILIILSLFQKGLLPRIGGFVLGVFFLLFFISLIGTADITMGYSRNDTERYTTLLQINEGLEVYFSKNRKYPGISGENQWEILAQALEISDLPNDPCHKENPSWAYQYRVSLDGQKYILKANFQGYMDDILMNDLDGNILGIFCGRDGPLEREYCISQRF